MKFLSFFINFLLVLVLFVTSVLFIVNRRLSVSYIDSLATRTKAYQSLSQLVPTQLADQSSDNPKDHDQILSTMQTVLTPEYLQTQLTAVGGQFEASLGNGGHDVTINLGDIAVKARTAGLDVKDNTFKSVTVSDDKLHKPADYLHLARTVLLGALIASVLLLILSLFLSYWRGSYGALGASLVVAGVLEAVLVIALFIVPDKLLAKVDFTGNIAPFSALIHTIAGQLETDLRLEFGIVAAVLLVVGILVLSLRKRLPARHHEITQPTSAPAPKSAA